MGGAPLDCQIGKDLSTCVWWALLLTCSDYSGSFLCPSDTSLAVVRVLCDSLVSVEVFVYLDIISKVG